MGSWHFGHTDNAGADFTMFADFLLDVLAEEVLLLGTAIWNTSFSRKINELSIVNGPDFVNYFPVTIS